MITVQVTGNVRYDGTLVLLLPSEVPPGKHEMILIVQTENGVDESRLQANGKDGLDPGSLATPALVLPIHHSGFVDDSLTFRREELYDDWGR